MNRFPRPSYQLPEGPPPEVLEEIDAAWERAQALTVAGVPLSLERLTAVGVVALACGQTVEAFLAGATPPRLAA